MDEIKEIELTVKELVEYLTCDKEHGLVAIDHYRRIIDFDKDYFIGIYYKDFIDIRTINEENVNDVVELDKGIEDKYNLANYGMTTKQRK